jgi:DNA-binding CsgD family transcriptional regulator
MQNQLTPRELAVVGLLGSGCTYKQVAVRLGVSPHTVVAHIKNLYRKLDAHTAAGAVMRAVQLGLLEVPVLQSA